MPDTTVKLQDITPVKSTFDNDDQILLINPTGEARISKEDFLDAMPDAAITLIGDITTTGIEGDTVAKQLGALKNSKAAAITDTASGAIANFPDGAKDIPVTSLVANIEPKQSGSGDPAPDNIRPISGWTGCNVTRMGKNLCEPTEATYKDESGSWFNGTDIASVKNALNTLPVGKYAISFKFDVLTTVSGATSWGILIHNTASGYIDGRQNGQHNADETLSFSKTFSVTESNKGKFDHVYMYSGGGSHADVYWYDFQLELGSTATTYEPYQAETVSVDWTTEAGTVYGGTIDVAMGLLTVEYVKKTVTSFGGTWGALSNGYGYYAVFSDTKHDVNSVDPDSMKSNIFKYNREGRQLMPLYSYGGNSGGDTTQTFILPSTVTTLADANAWLADNPTECTFKLATPQIYQLTGQQLKTLYGTNNVWADTGNVSVTYPADTKMFIEKLTMPTEDDLVANQAITSGKYFMIGNSLYLALANIASGAQITIGTNAQRVSLADALNAINS